MHKSTPDKPRFQLLTPVILRDGSGVLEGISIVYGCTVDSKMPLSRTSVIMNDRLKRAAFRVGCTLCTSVDGKKEVLLPIHSKSREFTPCKFPGKVFFSLV